MPRKKSRKKKILWVYEVSVQDSPKRSEGLSLTFTAHDGQQPSIKDLEAELGKKFVGLKIGTDESQVHKDRVLISEMEPGKFTVHIPEEHISIMPQMLNHVS